LVLSRYGSPAEFGEDLLVHTGYGCDVWASVLKAGFSAVTIHCIDYPAGIAIEAGI